MPKIIPSLFLFSLAGVLINCIYFHLKYSFQNCSPRGRRHFDLLFQMVKYSFLALAALAMVNMSTDAFAPKTTSRTARTSLNAFTPPTLIIGPMIKRMREEQEKKKMPMASEQERAYEAPGLRVGSSAWKWPPVWPYDQSFFVPKEDLISQGAPDLAGMAGMMNGLPQVSESVEVKEKKTFDVIQYWNEEKGNVPTELDPEAIARLKK